MSSPPENRFTTEERHAMLALARSAIVGVFTGGSVKVPEAQTSCLLSRRGVFVTVHVDGRLRGCIGVIEGTEPLARSIVHCAESAASRDPRFPPLRPEDMAALNIEISVLSEIAPISPETIQIGRHGLMIVSGNSKRGLLLPQVATEHNLSREQFLEETCRKAGLPRDAWRHPGSEIFAFTCEVFSEADSK